MPSLKQKAGYDQHTSPYNRMPSKDRIFNVLWELKKQGKAKDTIKNIAKCLKRLNKLCDLDNPENVLAFIATFGTVQGILYAIPF